MNDNMRLTHNSIFVHADVSAKYLTSGQVHHPCLEVLLIFLKTGDKHTLHITLTDRHTSVSLVSQTKNHVDH